MSSRIIKLDFDYKLNISLKLNLNKPFLKELDVKDKHFLLIT